MAEKPTGDPKDVSKPISVYAESIRSAASVINHKLLVKGYFSTKEDRLRKLLFVSQDLAQLVSDSKPNAKSYENDRNIINIIYSLLDSQEIATSFKEEVILERRESQAQKKELKRKIDTLDNEIDTRNRRIADLNRDSLRMQMALKEQQMKVKNLEERCRASERNLELYTSEAGREMRRNKLEIERLSDRLSNQRNIGGDMKRRKLDDQASHQESDELKAVMDENNELGLENDRTLGFCVNIYRFLRHYVDMSLDLRYNDQPVKSPTSFMPRNDDLATLDKDSYNLDALNDKFIGLVRELETDKSDDTFQFRRNGKEQQLTRENRMMKKKLADLESVNARLLETARKLGESEDQTTTKTSKSKTV